MNTILSDKKHEVPASRNAGPDWVSYCHDGRVYWTFKGEYRGSVMESHYESRRQTRKEAWGY